MRDEISVPGLRRGREFHAGFCAVSGDIHDGCCEQYEEDPITQPIALVHSIRILAFIPSGM